LTEFCIRLHPQTTDNLYLVPSTGQYKCQRCLVVRNTMYRKAVEARVVNACRIIAAYVENPGRIDGAAVVEARQYVTDRTGVDPLIGVEDDLDAVGRRFRRLRRGHMFIPRYTERSRALARERSERPGMRRMMPRRAAAQFEAPTQTARPGKSAPSPPYRKDPT
jgi:hypothetical protein